jgi:phosphate:Na+ symporter
MQVDWFRDILVPVIGGLGIFMLGLEFMTNGIQSLSVHKMRKVLAKAAGTPVTGLIAGTLITGVIQSSTAMTVMVVGLVDAGVLALRPAISVIMGANIGTTLTNALIALPLGPLGLLVAGFFALVMVFTKSEKVRSIALTCMGFALIFYGLSLMTGGLRPLRNIPEVIEVIRSLQADSFMNVVACVTVAAAITAMIHSSSATIGIVMGLGAAGVLDWQTALAFSLGADLGTTITSFIASLNLSKNAKRAAYAHIAFNFIGVAVMLPLFPYMTQLVPLLIGDPGTPVTVNGVETFPLVPVAVGAYSTAFNIFNTLLMFPFIGVFERVLKNVGRTDAEDIEDYSIAKYLDPKNLKDLPLAMSSVEKEMHRHLEGAAVMLAIAEEKVARRIQRDDFSAEGEAILSRMLAELGDAMQGLLRHGPAAAVAGHADTVEHVSGLLQLREDTLRLGEKVTSAERGALIALLGSAERAYLLIERIHAERRSVDRSGQVALSPVNA